MSSKDLNTVLRENDNVVEKKFPLVASQLIGGLV
jgi:hypothetical protein